MSRWQRPVVCAASRAALLAVGASVVASCATAPAGSTHRPASELRVDAVAEILRITDRRHDEHGALRLYLGDPDPVVRRWAARAAGQMGEEGHRAGLTELVSDPDTAVAATAAHALGRLPARTETVATLTELLAPETARGSVGYEAASSLGRLGTPEAAEAIDAWLAAARSGDPCLRAVVPAVLLAAWRFERPLDPELVRPWLEDHEAELRWRALYALVRRPVPAAWSLVTGRVDDPDPRVRALVGRFLASSVVDESGLSRAEALDHLRELAADVDPRVRIHALRALGSYRDGPSEVFAAGVRDPDDHVRLTAVEALGARGGVDATRMLGDMAEDSAERPEIRRAALERLGGLARSAVTPRAERWASSREWRDRAAAMRAAVAANVLDVAERGIGDPDFRVVGATVRALAAAGESGRATLRRAAPDLARSADPERRRIAVEAIASAPDVDNAALLPALFEHAWSEGDVRTMLGVLDAAAAAEQIDVPAAAEVLALDPPRVSLVRRRAIEHFGDRARAGWGAWQPVETGRDPSWYVVLAEKTLALGRSGTIRAMLETSGGAVELHLYPDAAPVTVASLIELVEDGFFDGQEWPRVVPAFVAQGGDPRGDTSGGPGYTLRDEINRLRYRRGTIGMAHSGPDTAGSQFFVAFLPQPHLDGDYTVVGRVVDGVAVLERTLPGDRIEAIRMIDAW